MWTSGKWLISYCNELFPWNIVYLYALKKFLHRNPVIFAQKPDCRSRYISFRHFIPAYIYAGVHCNPLLGQTASRTNFFQSACNIFKKLLVASIHILKDIPEILFVSVKVYQICNLILSRHKPLNPLQIRKLSYICHTNDLLPFTYGEWICW